MKAYYSHAAPIALYLNALSLNISPALIVNSLSLGLVPDDPETLRNLRGLFVHNTNVKD